MVHISAETKQALYENTVALVKENPQCQYVDLSVKVRDILRKAMTNHSETKALDRRRKGGYLIERIELWNVTDGDESADLLKNIGPSPDRHQIGMTLLASQALAIEYHGDDMTTLPPSLESKAILSRGASFRSMMSRGGGRTSFRIRYALKGSLYMLISCVVRTPKNG